MKLTPALARRLIRLSLECVDKEFPNKPSDVQSGPQDVKRPRRLHPAFYGCYDWHSAVHGHWALARVLRRFPSLPEAAKIRAKLDGHLTKARLAGEVAYFQGKHRRLFERPYGWGWLLRLAEELHGWQDPDAQRWARALQPLERLIARRTKDYLKRLSVPVRAGTHASTAFALVHIHDYARAKGDRTLRLAVERAAQRFYTGDRGCPTHFEPSGEDFISPCLAEADLMRRVLPKPSFSRWLDGFLPPLESRRFAPLRRPPRVLDPKDPRIGHLIGLSLQRAWAMRGIAKTLGSAEPRSPVLRRLADLHAADALGQMFDSGYGGAHWLASFALYLMTDAGR